MCATKAPLAGSREVSWKKEGIHQTFRARTCISTAVLIVLFLYMQSHPFPDTIMNCLYFIYFIITDFKIPYRWDSHVSIPVGSKLKTRKSNKYRDRIWSSMPSVTSPSIMTSGHAKIRFIWYCDQFDQSFMYQNICMHISICIFPLSGLCSWNCI